MFSFDSPYLAQFEFDENGKAVSFRGFEVCDFVECEKHGPYPTAYTDGVAKWPIKCGCPVCAKIALFEQRLKSAMIPPRFLQKTFENYETKEPWQKNALQCVKNLADCFPKTLGEGTCLTLLGTPGTGKTHLACAYANDVIAQGYSALFTSVSKAIRTIRSTWGNGNEADAYAAFVEVDLLILDEVGVQTGTENEQQIIFNIINERYNAIKPTVIISNKDKVGVQKYLGERVWDRLKENGGVCLNFNGRSYRK